MDKIKTKKIFKETNLLSVNQINAQIKLTEVWKSIHTDSYPTKWTNRTDVIKRPGLKASNKPDLITTGTSNIQAQTFFNDAAKVWNDAPKILKECATLVSAKKQIKIYIRTLPI